MPNDSALPSITFALTQLALASTPSVSERVATGGRVWTRLGTRLDYYYVFAAKT